MPFCAIALGVFALDLLVPPLVLTVARKPVTAFTINPLLPTLPGYLVSGPGSLGERLAKAWGLALFWFSADNSFGLEWGFAVTTADLARFAFMALLVALYFALWMERRARFAVVPWGRRAGGTGGARREKRRRPRSGAVGVAARPGEESAAAGAEVEIARIHPFAFTFVEEKFLIDSAAARAF